MYKYGLQGGRWLPAMNSDDERKISRLWSDILKIVMSNSSLFNFYDSNLKIGVGDGCRIHCWVDRWCMNIQLKEEFARLYSLSMEKEDSIKDFVQRRRSTGEWMLSFRRCLLSWEEEEVGRLQGLLSNALVFRMNCPDFLQWEVASSSQFTVASWLTFIDSEGRIIDSKALRKRIFYRGVDPGLRKEVWPFLLGYHAYDSTSAEREYLMSVKKSEYEAIKNQWQSISTEQAKRFTKFRYFRNEDLAVVVLLILTPLISPNSSKGGGGVGMSIDPKLFVSNFPVIMGTLPLLIGGKTILVAVAGRLFGISIISAIRVGLLLAPGGEFAFVAFGEAVNQCVRSLLTPSPFA
ncbi:hypothetical protein LOK49_LG12G00176 [Camellia lanceoleosa]|uniref:Uncharacterized protein n=1 Tax=Camellia lanceoleosa TaxID=1840588 RepID=A0ACC0FV53_9ERIC|nr:hypothetical protein LOK49_LG12G00176 [Camellia lanceoleosa]